MKEFLKKELYSLRAVTAILARWLLLAVPTGLVCGAVGTAFHLAVEHVTEWRGEHVWLLWLLPLAGLAIVALYKLTGCEGLGRRRGISCSIVWRSQQNPRDTSAQAAPSTAARRAVSRERAGAVSPKWVGAMPQASETP